MTTTGKPEVLRKKPRPSATFPTTNLTWTDLEPNQGFRGKKPATKRVINNLNNT